MIINIAQSLAPSCHTEAEQQLVGEKATATAKAKAVVNHFSAVPP